MAGKSWYLSRRTFLRGAGAAIALPLLDVMRPLTRTATAFAGPTTAPAAAAATPPVRMAVLYFPNGVWTDAWIPKAKGADFELPYSLAPLEPMKGDITVLSGLDKKASHSGDGHYAKTANFLTGGHVNKTTGKEISAGGVSLDQLVARHVGGQTPIPSLELGIDPVVPGIDTNVGYTRLYGSYISWREPNVPVAREINPRAVYDRLFGPKDAHGRPAGTSRAADDDRSLLDLALEDAGDLRRRVGRDDQVKLDEYLEAVRAAEKRIAFASKPDPRGWRPPTTPDRPAPPRERPPTNYLDHVRAMLDLMVLAFWTDSTRVATFMFANDVSPRNLSALIDGVSGGHHQMSHHQNDKEKIEQYKRINRWHVQQFAATLDKLRSIREGEGTLLDNAMLLFGSSMSDGNRHDPSNLPLVLAGRGGGTLRPGRHVASPGGTPLCNLYVSMLDRMGVAVDRFGDSNGKLAGLEA